MKWKTALSYLLIVAISAFYAVCYAILIIPNNFAPSGLTGICVMIQYVFGINMGYLNLLINIPLFLLVFFLVSRKLACRAMTFVVGLSIFMVVFEYVDFSAFSFSPDFAAAPILGALAGGALSGISLYGLMRAGSHSGNIEFISSLIHKHNPNIDFYWITFGLNLCVATASYFVYGFQLEPVVLCLLYALTSSSMMDMLVKRGRSAVRFEIITEHPQEISDAIIHRLHHSATLLPATGMYQGKATNVLVCVVNRTQVAEMNAIVRSFPNTFAAVSHVNAVVGNFMKMDKNGQQKPEVLDRGDIESV